MILRMNFIKTMLVLLTKIMNGETIFEIKSKDFHVERPFFSKKRVLERLRHMNLSCCDLNILADSKELKVLMQ